MHKLVSNIKKIIVAFLAVTALLSAAILPACEATPAPNADCYEALSGTIRWVDSATWIVLDDAGHAPTGFGTVEKMDDRVRIHYNFTADKVSSVQVTPDEAFASADVRVGASVALSHTDVYFYMPAYGATPVPPALLSKSGANVWVTGSFEVDCENAPTP